MTTSHLIAPGAPGIEPRWTSSAKTGLGTSISNVSRVWFTLSHGILNEIYYPRLDQACIRDLGFIVTDGASFFSEEKRDCDHVVQWLAEGAPAFKLINTCRHRRYCIEKVIVTDSSRNTVFQRVKFTPNSGVLADFHLHVLVAPHLQNHGSGNYAWIGDFAGRPMLFARRNDCTLALACSVPWTKRSAGYVGISDGWQDLHRHFQMKWEFSRADNGNVALTAGINIANSNGEFDLALGFGGNSDEAAENAIGSLDDGFDRLRHDYLSGWQEWQETYVAIHPPAATPGDLTHKSMALMRAHESKQQPGAFIASLAIPWGFSKGDEDQGGYHLVWSRDMVETAGGLLASGAHEDARRVLSFLQKSQLSEGRWSQNMWLDGSPYWNGIQMDETALPILLVDLARRQNALSPGDLANYFPMVLKAAGYLARNGPVSPQDRWEEDPGYTPFTVAAEIAAMLAAADLADLNHQPLAAIHLREIADVWNESIERWMYMSSTEWCRKFQVDGYYVRIASNQPGPGGSKSLQQVRIKNVTASEDTRLASHLVSTDALAFVRFGLRAPDDPRICNTVTLIDSLLKVETPNGTTWHRYNDDGYGEHADGSPFDGTGIGRGWPFLTGERAHYELAAGRTTKARDLLGAMESFANESGMISEQIWDSPDISERHLRYGRPSGSAMPLIWAHAEYLKLRRSLRDGRIFDQPPQTVRRYLTEKTVCPRLTWRFNHKLRSLPTGKILRVEVLAPAVVHWSSDDWHTSHDIRTHDMSLGIHLVDLPTQSLNEGMPIRFTFYWPESGRWEGTDFLVRVANWKQNFTQTAHSMHANRS